MKWTDLRMQLVEENRMHVRGKVHGRIYFVRDNKQLSRLPGNMDGKRWRKDPKFEGSRAAAYEFGAVTKLSQTIRGTMYDTFKSVSGHRELHAKLTGKFLRSLKYMEGQRGKRVLPAERLAQGLKGMAWHKRGYTTLAPHAATQVVHEPITLKPRIDFGYLSGGPKLPTWATHVRPFCTVIALSDLVRHKKRKRYTPKHRPYHGQARRVDGEILSIREAQHKSLTPVGFRPHLIFPEAVQGPYTLLVLVGLEAIAYKADGTVLDTVCIAMETAWTGNIGKTIAEERIKAEYEAQIARILPEYRQLVAQMPQQITYHQPGMQEDPMAQEAFESSVKMAQELWEKLLADNGIKPYWESS